VKSSAPKKLVELTLEQVVAALDVLPLAAFPNAVAAQAAAVLVLAVRDDRARRAALDDLNRERLRLKRAAAEALRLEAAAAAAPEL
jgi:hypothetical protein